MIVSLCAVTAHHYSTFVIGICTFVFSRQAGNQRISVCVRKRPLTHAESRRGEADVVTTPGGECVIVHEGKEAVDLTQYILQVNVQTQ